MSLLFFAVFASVAVQILQNRSIYLCESSTKKGLRKSRKPSLLLTKSTLYLFGSPFVARPIGIEPTATRRRRPVLYPLSYGRIYELQHGFYHTVNFICYIICCSYTSVFDAPHRFPVTALCNRHCVIV